VAVQTRPAQLRDLVDDYVARRDEWSPHVRFDLTERYFQRLHRDDDVEVWLICWDLGQDTLLHDHGGSVGAFAVASGQLIEDHGLIPGADTTQEGLRTRRHRAGDSVGFGRTYLHNLVNVGMEPAISIHAYSKPLTSMNFYCWLPSGIHHLREVPCDTPEPDTTALELTAARMREVAV
jgi:predicted metal-dependent enzyme (double-stranded beta helix superfamily)